MTRFLGTALLVSIFSLSAFADHHEGAHGGGHKAGHDHGACSKDVETLCPAVRGGHGAIVKCLKDNEAKLSAGCGTHIKEAKEAMKDVREACHADFEKFCHDVKPGGGRVIKCMKEHAAELSAECKTEMEQRKEQRKKR